MFYFKVGCFSHHALFTLFWVLCKERNQQLNHILSEVNGRMKAVWLLICEVFLLFSMSLHLGNEVFDVYKAPLQGDHNHLFIRQGTGLQGQAVFKTKLTFR